MSRLWISEIQVTKMVQRVAIRKTLPSCNRSLKVLRTLDGDLGANGVRESSNRLRWWSWTGSNRRPLECHSGIRTNNNINNSNLAGRRCIKNHHFSRFFPRESRKSRASILSACCDHCGPAFTSSIFYQKTNPIFPPNIQFLLSNRTSAVLATPSRVKSRVRFV